MIFVDTGAWFAMSVPSDQDHAAIAQCFSQTAEPLFTTDYVVDETLTLLRARGYGQRALALGAEFFSGSIAELHYLDEDEIRAAWEVFRRYADKQWSFTDCASKVVMERLRITQAISLDHHFRQFGNLYVLP
ncbi:MAG: type II toxin-antitoxin system VapC family toxin [Acidobacteria bacterium]|nr:type II toxin-antitoxin system VapC family toxin [Acidobacteriota bacterium]MBI3427346.1 type II toxin-antitoxin system VapC family toxin [Acidobacteriota bacterium]